MFGSVQQGKKGWRSYGSRKEQRRRKADRQQEEGKSRSKRKERVGNCRSTENNIESNWVSGGKETFANIRTAKEWVYISLEDKIRKLIKAAEFMKMNGSGAEFTPPEDVIEAKAKRTVVYRCVNTKIRKPENAEWDHAGNSLRDIANNPLQCKSDAIRRSKDPL